MAQRILNWKREPKDDRDLPSIKHIKALGVELPKEYELPKIPTYDQLDEGSCTSNGGCISFRFEWFQKFNNFNFEPSRQFVYYNTRDLEGTTNEDAGAYVRDVFKSMNKFGVASESVWPYSKPLTQKPSNESYDDALNRTVVKYTYVKQNLNTIKQTVYGGACVIFGFDVYSSFESGNWHKTTGMMPIPKKSEQLLGGHCVTIVGWSDSKEAFLIQNSWGEDWGQKGKFWMPYSYALDSSHSDDFWCIDEIFIKDAPNPKPEPNIDLYKVVKTLFPTKIDLVVLRPLSLVTLGDMLGLPVSVKNNKNKNFLIIATALGLP